jgi:tricorn protease
MYDHEKKTKEQLTRFEDVDINHMAAGPEDLVFVAGGKLYLLNLGSRKYQEVKIDVVSDLATLMPRAVNVGKSIDRFLLSPDGKRALFEARGDLFSIPQENGVIVNLTHSSGAFDSYPSWSPNGKWIAYWSDASGENEIWFRDNSSNQSRKLTSIGTGMGWRLFWSPDSKKLAFINQEQQIQVLTIPAGTISVIDTTTQQSYSALQDFKISWSSDSKWLAYAKPVANSNTALFLYNLDTKKLSQTTSGYYNDANPVFDKTGKYLIFTTDRNFVPSYSSFDNTWIYPNSMQLAVAALEPSTEALFYPKNDDVKLDSTAASQTSDTTEKKRRNTAVKKPTITSKSSEIQPTTLEQRIEILPVPPGNLSDVYAIEGKVLYLRAPNTGAPEAPPTLQFYDIEKREEKTLLAGAMGYDVSRDGKNLLVQDKTGFAILKPEADQKVDKILRTAEMEMVLQPKEEWKEIFEDTWRRYRDFFYDPGMQQVNWKRIHTEYAALLEDAITRWDITTIQSEMISELSAGHTYARRPNVEEQKNRNTGFLGIDWELDRNAYRIRRIARPAVWDNEVRSPLELSGVNVKEGDYILSVNGRPLDPAIDPYAMFEGLDGKAVALRVNSKPTLTGAKEVIVKTLTLEQETRLRNLEWVENNRKKVEALSGGQLGYMYMPNTGTDGQTELMRQFYGQIDKKGFVIDERFNAGGQLGDRFIEMLNRPVLYNIAWRNAGVTVWPIKGNNAPKVMLINGWAGSGGDAFPWAFQQLNMGPIVGERTVGILVGPATGHKLIDGSYITVPDARLYGADGKWFAEGYGIKPDFEVWDDPAQLAKGNDPQLNKAVEEAMKLVKTKPRVLYPRPAFEDRSAKGLKKQ